MPCAGHAGRFIANGSQLVVLADAPAQKLGMELLVQSDRSVATSMPLGVMADTAGAVPVQGRWSSRASLVEPGRARNNMSKRRLREGAIGATPLDEVTAMFPIGTHSYRGASSYAASATMVGSGPSRS